MTCTVSGCSLRKRGKNVEVSGTWDYKWPLGTRIRVAFQKPKTLSDAEAELVIQRFIELARRWERRTAEYLERHPKLGIGPTEFASDGIALAFLDDRVFDAVLGDDAPEGSEHRSPFAVEELGQRDYDVLISLDDLPLVRRDPLRAPFDLSSSDPDLADEEFGIQRIRLPLSELGSYAKRIDYGLPTAFLGRPIGFGEQRPGKGRSLLLDYLDTVAGAHVVVHEVGHILGLAHMHQAPQFAESSFRPAGEIARILQLAFGLDEPVPARFAREQVTLRWRGSLSFSDWPNLGPIQQLQSVMACPAVHDFLRQSKLSPEEAGRAMARALSSVEDPTKQSPILTQPTDTDVETLLIMYGGSAVRRVVLDEQAKQLSSSQNRAPAA